MNLKNFNYRKEKVSVNEIFPKFDKKSFEKKFPRPETSDPHQLIFDLCLKMWEGGYEDFLNSFGFYQNKYSKFSGHCHQITPVLGCILQSWGFKVAYLECYRVDPKTGKMVSPEEEPNPKMKEEFCSIGRIPYCCLEVELGNEKFYLTGKHLKKINDKPKALLSPVCYREMVGVFHHQGDPKKSGVYLETVEKEPFVWKKQTERDPEQEYFKTYLYMNLVF